MEQDHGGGGHKDENVVIALPGRAEKSCEQDPIDDPDARAEDLRPEQDRDSPGEGISAPSYLASHPRQ